MGKHNRLHSLGQMTIFLLVGWTVMLIVMGMVTVEIERDHTRAMAVNIARTNYNKDLVTRKWAASHGGVYVPVDNRTQPNPYLSNVKEKIITTDSGRTLTLMNPAYMMRQIYEEYPGMFNSRIHITSLKALRPGNAPDPWEIKALNKLSAENREYYEFVKEGGEWYLKYMGAFVTEKGCLKCHAHQGYKEGDIRGGVSTYMTIMPLIRLENSGGKIALFAMLWGSGIVLILFLAGLNARRVRQLDAAQANLFTMNEHLEQRVAEETAQRIAQERMLMQQGKYAAMGQMMSAVTHQWKQPLNAVSLLIQNLDDAYQCNELDAETVRETTDGILQQLQYMSETVDDFRRFFRPGEQSDSFTIGGAIRSVLTLVRTQFRNNNITISLHCQGATGCCAFDDIDGEDLSDPCLEMPLAGNINDLKQVLLILLNNARDAVLANEVPEEGRKVVLVVRNMQHTVSMKVCDSGGGIPADVFPHLFRQHFTTKGEHGTGLGLFLAKTIIEKSLKGSIIVGNENGGACFELHIPKQVTGAGQSDN